MAPRRSYTRKAAFALAGCLMLQSVGVSFAEVTDEDLRKQAAAEVARIQGTPSARKVRTVVKYVERVVVDHKAAQAQYTQGREKGQQEVLSAVKNAPAPEIITSTATTEAKLKVSAGTRITHRQSLSAQFLDTRMRPRAEMAVSYIVQSRDGDGKDLVQKDAVAVKTDASGRVMISDLPVPCAIRWQLPGEEVRLTELAEWSFQDPGAEQLAVTKYTGETRVAVNLPTLGPRPRLARRETGLLRVAANELRGLRLALAPAPRKPVPIDPKVKTMAEDLLKDASRLYESGAKNLAVADDGLQELNSPTRQLAVKSLRDAIKAAAAASQLLRYRDARAHAYQARAVYWLPEKGSQALALRKLDEGLKALPGNPLLLKARAELAEAPGEAKRVYLVGRERLRRAEELREKDGLTSSVRAELDNVLLEGNTAIEWDEGLSGGYLLQGRALVGLGRGDEALPGVESACVRFPKDEELAALLKAIKTPKIVYHHLEAEPIVLQRNLVDFAMSGVPRGAVLYVPGAVLPVGAIGAGDAATEARLEVLPVQRTGETVHFRLPAYATEGKEFPVQIRRETDAAAWEGLSTIDARTKALDPYATANPVEAPPLSLVRIKKLDLKDANVLETRPVLRGKLKIIFNARLPGQKPPKNPKESAEERGLTPAERTIENMQAWWEETADYAIHFRVAPGAKIFDEDRKGASLKGAELEDRIKKSPIMADILRLKTAAAGNVAGITVGSTKEALIQALGEPQERIPADNRTTFGYLGRGVLFNLEGGKVVDIRVMRPTQLLQAGTTAFAERNQARVFVKEYGSFPGAKIATPDEFKRFLDRTGIIQTVQGEADADYVITFRNGQRGLVRARGMTVRGNDYPENITFVHDATLLIQDRTSGEPTQEIPLRGKVGDDYARLLGEVIRNDQLAREAKTPKQRKSYQATADFYLSSVQSAQARMLRRAPRAAEQDVYELLADRLYGAIDLQSRVTAIDYEKGELNIPLGKQHHIEQGMMFDLFVNGERLTLVPEKQRDDEEEGMRDREYYLAQVTQVNDTTSRCKVVRFRNKQDRRDQFKDNWEPEDAPFMVQRLPQARSGVVSVRARAALPVEDDQK